MATVKRSARDRLARASPKVAPPAGIACGAIPAVPPDADQTPDAESGTGAESTERGADSSNSADDLVAWRTRVGEPRKCALMYEMVSVADARSVDPYEDLCRRRRAQGHSDGLPRLFRAGTRDYVIKVRISHL